MTNHTLPVSHKIFEIIEEARNAEIIRDTGAMHRILSEVWENTDDYPSLEFFDEPIQGEILRLCGFYLSYYGRARNLKDYQERGKDFLTKAIEIFDAENLTVKSDEAKVTLSLCYWHEGAVYESEAILSEIEDKYSENKLHDIYLQVCANRLGIYFFNQEFEKSKVLVKSLAGLVRLSKNLRLKTMFHNQAGLIARNLNQFDAAIIHYNEAMLAAREAGNERFCAINFNNLGFVYKELGDFKSAHEYIDKAVNFFRQLGETGWLAQTLDSRASVYLAENKLGLAMETINSSLEILEKGEDFAGLVGSLFTKCEILARRGEPNDMAEIVTLSAEIQMISRQRIKESVAKTYANKIAGLFIQVQESNITHFDLSSFNASFIDGRRFEGWAFKIRKSALPELSGGNIVFVEKRKKADGQAVIVQNHTTNEFICGVLEKDNILGKFGLRIDDDMPLPIDDYKYFGAIVGYCPFDQTNNKDIIFRPFIKDNL